MSLSESNTRRRRIRQPTLMTHCLAALLGAGVTVSFNSVAQSPEVMLGKLAPNDFEGLKNYLTFKANDYYGDRAKNQQKEAELEERLDQTTRSLAQLTQQVTQAVAQMTRSQNQMAQTTSQLTRSESQLNQHLAQTDQQLTQLQQRDTSSAAKQTSGTFTTPFTVSNGKRTVLKVTSDDKDGDVLILGDGGAVQVFTKSSDTQVAELSGYGYGAVTTHKPDGTATAVMGSRSPDGSGFIQLSSSGGNPAVDAEVTGKGVGVVRVGPGGNGPAGVVGGSPMPASMIQGNGK